jgi:hypothetical protein
MLDLDPYRPVSNQPAIRRDLSVAVAEPLTEDELGDRVRLRYTIYRVLHEGSRWEWASPRA